MQTNTASLSRLVHSADPPEVAQLNGHGHVRREGRDQLTDGQFCAIRGGRSGHNRLTHQHRLSHRIDHRIGKMGSPFYRELSEEDG